MNSNRRPTQSRNPVFHTLTLWNNFARDQAPMLWSAGEVIGRRTAEMASHGLAPNAVQRAEMQRMVDEKQSAALESSVAAWTEWTRISQKLWLDAFRMTLHSAASLAPAMTAFAMMRPHVGSQRLASTAATRTMIAASRLIESPFRIAEAAMKPVHQRVVANRKRLSSRD